LVDKELFLNNKDIISKNFKLKIMEEVGKGKSYEDILDMFPYCGISTMSISGIFRGCIGLKNVIALSSKVIIKKGQQLNICVDDCFVSV
jgi:hypothetical protein